MSVAVTVRYFGPAKDLADGKSVEVLEVITATATATTSADDDNVKPMVLVNQVIEAMKQSHGSQLAELVQQQCGVVVNLDYVEQPEWAVKQVGLDDEVLVVPPVSSG